MQLKRFRFPKCGRIGTEQKVKLFDALDGDKTESCPVPKTNENDGKKKNEEISVITTQWKGPATKKRLFPRRWTSARSAATEHYCSANEALRFVRMENRQANEHSTKSPPTSPAGGKHRCRENSDLLQKRPAWTPCSGLRTQEGNFLEKLIHLAKQEPFATNNTAGVHSSLNSTHYLIKTER